MRFAGLPTDGSGGLPARLAGAPIDLIKLAAAFLMLADHVNSSLLGGSAVLAWRFGRIAFPLFCFVLACHLVRDTDLKRYLLVLLVLAVATQPFYTAAFPWWPMQGNILFTLGAGAAIAASLLQSPALVQHLTLGIGAAVAAAWPSWARGGVDFGLAGVLLPSAIALIIAGRRGHVLWLVPLVFALNAGAPRSGETWLAGAILDALFAGVGPVLVIGCAALVQGLPRFLPRYALHAFYPGHLVGLAGLRWIGIGT
jgi:hypothetical protein